MTGPLLKIMNINCLQKYLFLQPPTLDNNRIQNKDSLFFFFFINNTSVILTKRKGRQNKKVVLCSKKSAFRCFNIECLTINICLVHCSREKCRHWVPRRFFLDNNHRTIASSSTAMALDIVAVINCIRALE